jgi:ribose 5-phosphate isomerase B
MKVYIAIDHNGWELKNFLVQKCKQENIEIIDLTPEYDKNDDYPLEAKKIAQKIENEPESFGVAICGSGQGIAMALNRFNWIRAGAKVVDLETAKNIRLHNHANVITFGAWDLEPEKAFEILKTFLNTSPDTATRHLRRIKLMAK